MRLYQAYHTLQWSRRADAHANGAGDDTLPAANFERSLRPLSLLRDRAQPPMVAARPSPPPERIVLIDTEDLSRDSLGWLLAHQELGSSISAFAGLDFVKDTDIAGSALVLLNVSGLLGGCAERLALLKAVLARFVGVPVLVISDQDDPCECQNVFAAGGSGFFPTSGDALHLLAAVRLLMAGEQFIPSRLLGELIRGNVVSTKAAANARAMGALLS